MGNKDELNNACWGIEFDGEIAPWFRCIAGRVMTDEWWDSIGNPDSY